MKMVSSQILVVKVEKIKCITQSLTFRVRTEHLEWHFYLFSFMYGTEEMRFATLCLHPP